MTMTTRFLWISLFALIMAACAGAADSKSAAVADALPADIAITAYQGADVLGGEQVKLSQVLTQGKPVVLNFWAGACPPCRLEMPDLQAVHEQYKDRMILFGLDVGPFVNLGTREDGKALVRELGVTYPVGSTNDASVVRSYKVIGMPTTYFITPQGKIIRTWTGLLTKDKLSQFVEELLIASSSG